MELVYLLILFFVGSFFPLVFRNRSAWGLSFIVTALGVIFTGIILYKFHFQGNINFRVQWIEKIKLFLSFRLDGLSLMMLMLTTISIWLMVWSNKNFITERKGLFYFLVLLMGASMLAAFLADDALLYYIFWEFSLLPVYLMILFWGSGSLKVRKRQLTKFFILTLAGSLFMLASIIYLYVRSGSFLLEDLYALDLSKQEQMWIALGFFMAYAIKIPLIPFHSWQAPIYDKAPAAGTILLSAVMLKMALYSLIRWQIPISASFFFEYNEYFILLGVVGVIYGSVLALVQNNIKKIFAYSSLAHVGLIAAAIYSMNFNGWTGAVMQMMAHAFIISGLFILAELMIQRLQTRDISEMGGIRTVAPKFVSLLMIVLFASVTLPGTFGFVGEIQMLFGIFQRNALFAIPAGLTMILGAYYMLRMFQKSTLGDSPTTFTDLSFSEMLPISILALVLIFFGVYPFPLYEWVSPTINEILQHINPYRP